MKTHRGFFATLLAAVAAPLLPKLKAKSAVLHKFLQNYIVTGVAPDDHGFNVFPHLEASVSPEMLMRVSRIDLSKPEVYTRIAP